MYNCRKFWNSKTFGLNVTLIKPKLDDFFLNCLRQSSKKFVATLRQCLLHSSLRDQYVHDFNVVLTGGKNNPTLPIFLPHPPSINVVGSDGSHNHSTRINIARGGRGNHFRKRRPKCGNIFFDDCLRHFQKKSSHLGFINVLFKPYTLRSSNSQELFILVCSIIPMKFVKKEGTIREWSMII